MNGLTKTLMTAALAVGATAAAVAAPRALIVVTNHADLGDTGKKTGYYLSEVSHPWKVLTAGGVAVDFASPKGGMAPLDPTSMDLTDAVNAEFWGNEANQTALSQTLSLADLNLKGYDAIVFAGGHGTMWDFSRDPSVAEATRTVYEQGGVVAAVCHGPAALVNAKLSNGKWLVDGKRVAAFTNAEEEAVGLTSVMPFLLETKLEQLGATVATAPNFETNVVVDGRLVTGQNPASATKLGEEVLRLVKSNASEKTNQSATTGQSPVLAAPYERMDGTVESLGQAYPNQVVLVVNTASRCGFTVQYEGLEALYQQYKEKGLVVVAFPSNDFGGQEPGSNEEILEFCTSRFNVTFPVKAKVPTKGENKAALYEALTGEKATFPGDVKWNFEKFIIDRQGAVVGRFPSRVKPQDPVLVTTLEAALSGQGE